MEMETNTEIEEPEGLDAVIAKVDSYIQDPKLVTPETLMELKTDLEDLKGFMDEEETVEEPEDKDDNGLMIMIGKHKGGVK